MIQTNIAIVGAGPAGSICAIMLQRAGIDCLLIDRATFPRDKLCGGGLTPRAWKLLDRVMPDFKYDYLPVQDLRACFEGQYKTTCHLSQPIRIVKRQDFDHLLVQEYLRLGGKMLKETLGTVSELEDGLLLRMRSGEEVKCIHLVGADGANSQARRFLQPDFHADVLCLEQYEPRDKSKTPVITLGLSRQFDRGYYYEFPNTEFVAVGYGDHRTTVEEYRKVIQSYGFGLRKERGAMITVSQDYPEHPRVTLVGDAGGWIDDMSYEGIYYALATGYNASQAIIKGLPFAEVNAEIVRKKRHKVRECRLVYSKLGLRLMKLALGCRPLSNRLLNKYMGCAD